MLEYKTVRDADGNITHLETPLFGGGLLNTPKLNKNSAFTLEERQAFGLLGKLPLEVETLEQQLARRYAQYQRKQTPLEKNIFLNALHDSNEVLFFKLISEHLEEMLPIIYTPTVGEAVETFSLELRRPRGLYIDFTQQDNIAEILANRLNPEVDLVLVTDGEGVLGIGDQGIGGMNIAIAKLMVYTLCGGIHPNRVLPIQLDVGTNNKTLLQDPMYLGWRHERVRGADYDIFIDKFVTALRATLPNVYLHWEDFGRENARRNLNRYRHSMATFNDDMQGTGATALACVLAAVKASGGKLPDQRIIIFGAGTAGVGIADQLQAAMIRFGIGSSEAYKRFWLIDRCGLLTDDMDDLPKFQLPYARAAVEIVKWPRNAADQIDLLTVVKQIKPTILIGCSTVHGAFDKPVITEMAKHVAEPIILPLSNPTHLSEATPIDIYKWTKGQALIATGSPFPKVNYDGCEYSIAQSNNAYVFPGIGLGVIASQAKRLSDNMIWAACDALSDCSPARHNKCDPLLPDITQTCSVSVKIALAVAHAARQEGLAGVDEQADLMTIIERLQWVPRYYPYKRAK